MTETRYTAEMHRIRDAVASSDWMDIGDVTPETIQEGYDYFDRVFSAHDAEVAANALREAAYSDASEDRIDGYGKTWLLARADRIEREGKNNANAPETAL